MRAYQTIGLALPHFAASQATMGTPVNFAAGDPILPGDLLFRDRTGQPLGHVGIAISATEWIVAPNTGEVIKRAPIYIQPAA